MDPNLNEDDLTELYVVDADTAAELLGWDRAMMNAVEREGYDMLWMLDHMN